MTIVEGTSVMNGTDQHPLPPAAPSSTAETNTAGAAGTPDAAAEVAPEVGGPSGPEPTRFGDWERKGRCIDF